MFATRLLLLLKCSHVRPLIYLKCCYWEDAAVSIESSLQGVGPSSSVVRLAANSSPVKSLMLALFALRRVNFWGYRITQCPPESGLNCSAEVRIGNIHCSSRYRVKGHCWLNSSNRHRDSFVPRLGLPYHFYQLTLSVPSPAVTVNVTETSSKNAKPF